MREILGNDIAVRAIAEHHNAVEVARELDISSYLDGARLLPWFAGHGGTLDGEAYLVPTDAPTAKLDSEFRLKAISLRRFGEYMREAKARQRCFRRSPSRPRRTRRERNAASDRRGAEAVERG